MGRFSDKFCVLQNVGQSGLSCRDTGSQVSGWLRKTIAKPPRSRFVHSRKNLTVPPHSGELIRTIETLPNKWLASRTSPAKGRPERDTGLLWPRAGSVMIAERSRLNTQRALAVRLPQRGLSNVWWPVKLHNEDERAEKVIAMWLNSTLGTLTLVAHRVPTEGSWVQFKTPTIENLPILDVRALSERQLTQLASSYESSLQWI